MQTTLVRILTLLLVTFGWTAASNAQLNQVVQIGQNKIGSVTDNGGGSYSIVGGGNDIWDQRDEFTFAYTEVTGDFDMQVRVESLEPNARWSKAGLMARESLSEYSKMAFALITPPDVPTSSGGNGGNYTAMGYRTGLDNNAGVNGGQHEDRDGANTIGGNNLPNGWLRLARIGNTIFSSNSLDGVTWQLVASQNTATWGGGALKPTLFVGLATSRHSGGPTAAAEFRNFQFNYGAPFNVVSVSNPGHPSKVRIQFSRPVGAGATTAGNYTLSGTAGTIVRGLRFTTANDADVRDPMTFILQGTTGPAASGPWTDIASGNTGLPTTRLTTAPDVLFANNTPYTSYRIIFPTVRNAASANSMQIAEVAFLDANGNDVTSPGNPVIPSSANHPAGEPAPAAIDNNNGSKYLNFDELNTGFTVTPTAPAAAVLSATVISPTVVELNTSLLAEGQTYSVTVAGVVADDATALGTTTGNFVQGAGYEARRILITHNKTDDNGYYRISDAVAKGIGDVLGLGGGVFPAVQSNTLFEDPTPDNGNNERFSTRISGVLNITTSGNYNFAVSSDDLGFLYLGSDDMPATKVQIAREPEWNGSRQYDTLDRRGTPVNRAGPIALQAGKKYYLEYVFTEGGGGNNGSAAWQPPGGPAIVNGSLPIPESAFAPSRLLNGTTYYTLGDAFITQQPTSLTAPAGTQFTFSSKADGTPPWALQWYRNGAAIPGANGFSYTATAQFPDDNGAQYYLVATGPFNSATSSVANLTVTIDLTPPTLVNAHIGFGNTNIFLRFSEIMGQAGVEDEFSYTLSGGAGVIEAIRFDGGSNVVLTTTLLTPGASYTLSIADVVDLGLGAPQPNVINPNPTEVSLTAPVVLPCEPGVIQRDVYLGNVGGNVLQTLFNNPKWPGNPDQLLFINTTVGSYSPDGLATENYGMRYAGHIIPPTSGNYVFEMHQDDSGRFRLGTTEDGNSAVTLVNIDGSCCGFYPSPAVPLLAGKAYYFDAIMQEGGGGDYLDIRWKPPGTSTFVPIPSANLSYCYSMSINAQPAGLTVLESRDASFTVGTLLGGAAQAVGKLRYQWERSDDSGINWAPIMGANSASYTLPLASIAADDDSQFRVVVTVAGTTLSETSQPAELEVVPDDEPPFVVSAVGSPTFDKITLVFNEALNASTATDNFSYVINPALNILGATISPDLKTVTLTTDPQAENTVYTIDYSAVADYVGNINSPAIATVDVNTYVVGCGGVELSLYNQVGGGTDIFILVNHPTFPNSPSEIRRLNTFDTGADIGENYGGRVRGLFIPPTTGAWNLFVTADDGSQLFFNPNGPSAAGKVLISQETPGCCTAFAGRQTGPFNLVAGQGYYVEGIYKEAGGGDYIRVAARLASDTVTALAPIPAEWAGFPAAPPGVGGPVIISQQPASLSITQNLTASFSVAASNPNGLPLCYQWKRNGVDIPGATGPTFSYGPVPLSDDDAVFEVVVSVIGTRVTSAQAVLDVQADLTAPFCVEARGTVSLSNVVVRFNEIMDPSTATDNFNYAVDGGAFGVIAVVMNPDNKSVTVSLDSAYAIGSTHTIVVSGVADLAGNVIDPNPCTLTFAAPVIACNGFLYFETFKNIPNADLASLTSNPNYPNNPTEVAYMGGFDSRFVHPTDALENYGARMRGLFIPPTSGNWIFYLRSDDASRLLLNPTGTDAAGAVVLTEELGCCGNFAGHASAPQALTAGQPYYIEGLYKEGGGGDYMQVAAKLSTDPTDPNSLSPISGRYLTTLVDPVGASVAIATHPTDKVHVLDPQAIAVSNVTFTAAATGATAANPNGPIYYQWERDNGSGFSPIPGANGTSYSFSPRLADNGARFRLTAAVPGACAESDPALLTVGQPNTPPVVNCGPAQSVLEDAGAQVVPGWASVVSVHSVTRVPIVYGSDFNALPPGSAISFNAAVSGGILHLTDAINSQTGGFVTPSVANPIESFTIDFKARIGGGTCCGTRTADGWSLTVGNIPVPISFPVAAEEGAGLAGGLVVSFDSWDNAGFGDDDAHTAPNVDLKVGGTVLAYQAFTGDREGGRPPSGPFINDPATMMPMSYSTGNDFVPVRVQLNTDGTVNVDFKNVRVINNVPSGLTLPLVNTRVAFGARTGGANDNHWIDDLSIVANVVDGSSAELGQTVSWTVTTDHPEYFSVQPAIAPDGTLTYTPAPNACGTAQVTAVARDNGGTAFGGSDSAAPCTFNIVIGCQNDCPVAVGQAVTTAEDVALAISIAASDMDGDPLTYAVGVPANGTLSGMPPALTYTPAPNYSGPDSFIYTVTDGLCSVSATVTINVTPVDDCPVAEAVVTAGCDTAHLTTIYIVAGEDDEGCVVLDGTLSTDMDSPTLQYSWFADGGLVPISVEALTTNCFPIGVHEITLIVDDGTCLGMDHVQFEVVTPCDLVEGLIDSINNSTLPRNKKRPLIDSLKKICKDFEKDKKNKYKNALKKLESFQKKLKNELKNYPTEQAQFFAEAQDIIDAINCSVELHDKKHAPRPPSGPCPEKYSYWRNNDSFVFWPAPYTYETLVSSAFVNAAAYPDAGGRTLLQALAGNVAPNDVKDLLKEGVTALLNASTPAITFQFSAANVIAMVNAALADGSHDALHDAKEALAHANHGHGCH